MTNKNYDEMKVLQEEFSNLYFDSNNVVAIGIGFYGETNCIIVHLEKDIPHNLPTEYKGVIVKYDITGQAYFL